MITTTIKVGKKVGTKFPKLMKSTHSDLIVRFQKPKVGIVLVGDEERLEGCYSKAWTMKYFEDFNDELTLKNK